MALDIDLAAVGAQNPLLQACTDTTRAELGKLGELREFDREEMLFREGEPGGIVLFPLEGSLQMDKTAHRGRRQVLCTMDVHECDGICLLTMPDQAVADVRALNPGRVLVLKREILQRLSHQDPVLCQTAWRAAAKCMTHFTGLVETLSFRKVAERVALSLLENTGQNGDLVRITQAGLAAEVGTTREVVARCLAELQSTGAVKLGRARITVLDREKLQAQAEES